MFGYVIIYSLFSLGCVNFTIVDSQVCILFISVWLLIIDSCAISLVVHLKETSALVSLCIYL